MLIVFRTTDGQGISCYWTQYIPSRQICIWIGNNILAPTCYSKLHKKEHLVSLIHYWFSLGFIETISEDFYHSIKNKVSLLIDVEYTKEPSFETFWIDRGFEDCTQEDEHWAEAIFVKIHFLKRKIWSAHITEVQKMINDLIRNPRFTEFLIEYEFTDDANTNISFLAFPNLGVKNG